MVWIDIMSLLHRIRTPVIKCDTLVTYVETFLKILHYWIVNMGSDISSSVSTTELYGPKPSLVSYDDLGIVDKLSVVDNYRSYTIVIHNMAATTAVQCSSEVA